MVVVGWWWYFVGEDEEMECSGFNFGGIFKKKSSVIVKLESLVVERESIVLDGDCERRLSFRICM